MLSLLCMSRQNLTDQGVVIPIGTIVTAVTGFKKWSRDQGVFLVSVKQSRTISKLGNSSQDVYVLRVHIAHSIVKCVRSNGQGPVFGVSQVVKQQKQESKFFDLVTAVTTVPMGVITPCRFWSGHQWAGSLPLTTHLS